MEISTSPQWFEAVQQRRYGAVRSAANRFASFVNVHGETALMLATRAQDPQMIEILVDYERGMFNRVGETALIIALDNDLYMGIELLAKAEANVRLYDGSSPLHHVVRANKIDFVPYLAPLLSEARDDAGRTALELAAELGNVEMMQRLIRHSAPPVSSSEIHRVARVAEENGHFDAANDVRNMAGDEHSNLQGLGTGYHVYPPGSATGASASGPALGMNHQVPPFDPKPTQLYSGSTQETLSVHDMTPIYDPTSSYRSRQLQEPTRERSSVPVTSTHSSDIHAIYDPPTHETGEGVTNKPPIVPVTETRKAMDYGLVGRSTGASELDHAQDVGRATLHSPSQGTINCKRCKELNDLLLEKDVEIMKLRQQVELLTHDNLALKRKITTFEELSVDKERDGGTAPRQIGGLVSLPDISSVTSSPIRGPGRAIRTTAAGTHQRGRSTSPDHYSSHSTRHSEPDRSTGRTRSSNQTMTALNTLSAIAETESRCQSRESRSSSFSARMQALYGPGRGGEAERNRTHGTAGGNPPSQGSRASSQSSRANSTLRRAPASKTNIYDETELMTAAFNGDLMAVEKLRGTQMGYVNRDGKTALMFAAERNHISCVTMLFAKEARAQDRNGSTAMMLAAQYGFSTICKALVRFEMKMRRADGMTALMLAAEHGHELTVSILIEHEAGYQDNEGRTALMLAAYNGHKSCCLQLIDKEVHLTDIAGHNAQWYAQSGGQSAIAIELRRYLSCFK
ncbi:Ankyrin repeat protein 1 [Giardia muris]|uniref:Ankyrin repeat protein 1 n=1 Tax=Giardia muris TaxID=5742 RepID=A0A4Z1SLH8_GIAMU|nr:Ankyrin repeat protein 1 [Giardia muris]|eukprot:TNJ26502.1 Ankyrin repeat protein 1 [Giardia muris]